MNKRSHDNREILDETSANDLAHSGPCTDHVGHLVWGKERREEGKEEREDCERGEEGGKREGERGKREGRGREGRGKEREKESED